MALPSPSDAVFDGERATLANWRLAPWSAWGFRHVRELIPTAGIARGSFTAVLGAATDPGLADLAFTGPDGVRRTIGSLIAESDTDGLVVLHKGRIAFEHYRDGVSPSEEHIVFSVSKSITALLAGIAVGHGVLDPDAPVDRYVPEVAGGAYADATVRHVLDMSVAITFIEDYLDPDGDVARYRIAMGWNPAPSPVPTAGLNAFVAKLPRAEGPHGHTFHYVSPNSDLLGWILERATGARFAPYMSEVLWKPLGAEADGSIAVDRLGAPRTAGGISVTLRDLARVGEMVRRDGEANGRQIVPASWIADLRRNGDPAAWARGSMSGLFPNGRYRSKWYASGNASGAFCGIGIHGQWLYVDPRAEVVIAKLSCQPLPVDDPLDKVLVAGFEAIAAAF